MKRKEILDRMGLCLPQGKQIRVVISSDVSNEADDPFAIVHQLLTPIFDVRGVIAAHYEGKTHGDRQSMENSYRMLTALMAATGMTDVPMLRGCAVPLAGELDVPDAEGVRFLIEEYDIAARHQLLHLVAAWAEAGGVLTLHEDGKRVLRVVCTQYPTMSTLNWLETLSLVFTAFSCPYWEDAAETSFLMPNTSDAPSKLLAVPGDAPETPLNLLIRNIGDTAITTLTISAAGKISFQGLTLAPGAAIRIHHNAGVFAAEMVSNDSTVSILPYRTPESADDLLLRPGVLNEIRVEASAAAFVSGRCKGRYC